MAERFSELDFILAPDEATARAMVEARRKALTRRRPRAGALAMTEDDEISRLGRSMLAEEEAFEPRVADLWMAKQKESRQRTMDEAELEVKREQLRYQKMMRDAELAFRREKLGLGQKPTAPMPAHTPAGGRPYPPVQLRAGLEKAAAAMHQTAAAFRRAMQVGVPEPGIRGTGQALQAFAARSGAPFLAGGAAEQVESAWYNVIRPLVAARTGAQMTVQELVREFNALAPQPGKEPETMLVHLHMIPDLLRGYTIGLPAELADEFNRQWDEIEAMLPQSVEELMAMRASGVPGQYRGAPRRPPAPPEAQPQLPPQPQQMMPQPRQAPPQMPGAPMSTPRTGTLNGRRVFYQE